MRLCSVYIFLSLSLLYAKVSESKGLRVVMSRWRHTGSCGDRHKFTHSISNWILIFLFYLTFLPGFYWARGFLRTFVEFMNSDFKFIFPQNLSLTSWFRPVALGKLNPALSLKANSDVWKYRVSNNLIELEMVLLAVSCFSKPHSSDLTLGQL